MQEPVAFDAGLHEQWDDLRWDADLDRKVLATQLESWQVDEHRVFDARKDLGNFWASLGLGVLSEEVPSLPAQQRVAGALDWLDKERARLAARVQDAVRRQPSGVQKDFATMLDEMCLCRWVP